MILEDFKCGFKKIFQYTFVALNQNTNSLSIEDLNIYVIPFGVYLLLIYHVKINVCSNANNRVIKYYNNRKFI